MGKERTVRIAAAIVVAAIYIAARFWDLTASCLWFDEIFSVHAAEHSWASILNFVALDLIHPPLFYVVLKIWIAVGGESLLWLRSLPVLFSILAIFPFILVCRELRTGYWTGVLAFFFMAVNGSLIKYAQEVRMYCMLMCVSLLSFWLFARFFRTGKGIVALTIVNLVLVYTHYFGWLFIASEIASVTMFQRIKWRPVTVMSLVTFLGFLPWAIRLCFAAGSGSQLSQNIGWMQRPDITSVAQLILSLVEPFYYQAASVDPISLYRISGPLFVIAAVALSLYLSRYKGSDESEGNSAKLLLTFFLTPVVVAFISSWILPYSVWGTRHLIVIFVPFLVLVAMSLTRVPDRSVGISLMTLAVLFSGFAFVVEASRAKQPPVWCGFEALAPILQSDEHGPIYVFEDLAAYHLWFEFRTSSDPKFRQRVVKVDDFPGMVEDKAYFVPRGMDDEYLAREKIRLDADRFQGWIVYRAQKFDVEEPPLDTLTGHGFRVVRKEVYDAGSTLVIAVYLEKNQ